MVRRKTTWGLKPVLHIETSLLTLLLNMTCPAIANSVDPDQLASSEAN